MKPKFDAQDREQTINEIESRLGVKLCSIGRRKKYLVDTNSNRYWVLGGYGHWHGIPEPMMDAEVLEQEKAILFVAVRKKPRIEIFTGSVRSLVLGRERLSRNKAGDYQFTVVEHDGYLRLKELPETRLTWFSAKEYSINQKQKDRKSYDQSTKTAALISKLSDEEKVRLLTELQNL